LLCTALPAYPAPAARLRLGTDKVFGLPKSVA